MSIGTVFVSNGTFRFTSLVFGGGYAHWLCSAEYDVTDDFFIGMAFYGFVNVAVDALEA
jgi:hypothetical protein